jgi:hypothetical protein
VVDRSRRGPVNRREWTQSGQSVGTIMAYGDAFASGRLATSTADAPQHRVAFLDVQAELATNDSSIGVRLRLALFQSVGFEREVVLRDGLRWAASARHSPTRQWQGTEDEACSLAG